MIYVWFFMEISLNQHPGCLMSPEAPSSPERSGSPRALAVALDIPVPEPAPAAPTAVPAEAAVAAPEFRPGCHMV